MSNQMKKTILICLIVSAMIFACMTIIFFVGGIGFNYFVSYIFWGSDLAVCGYLGYVYYLASKEDANFRKLIFYANKLLELREYAKLKFYKDFEIAPKYSADGKLMSPDEFIGILTELDEKGNLLPSIYEQLGLKPRFDENGNQIPTYIALKHIIKKLKTTGLDKIKISKVMTLKGSEKAKTAEAGKPAEKPKAPVASPAKKKEEKKKVEKKKADKPVFKKNGALQEAKTYKNRLEAKKDSQGPVGQVQTASGGQKGKGAKENPIDLHLRKPNANGDQDELGFETSFGD